MPPLLTLKSPPSHVFNINFPVVPSQCFFSSPSPSVSPSSSGHINLSHFRIYMPFPLCPHGSSLMFMSLLPTFCSWHSLILSHPVTIPCKAQFLDPFPICSHLPLDPPTPKTLAQAHCWSPPDSAHRSSLSLPSVTTFLKVFSLPASQAPWPPPSQ